MSMHWTIEEVFNGAGSRVLISGNITEESDFRQIASLAEGKAVSLDLAGVEQINSCGVREWIQFVRELSRRASAIEMVRCSPVIVRQLNMITNFRGGGQIRSVLLPYYCANCGSEDRTILQIEAEAVLDIPDEIPCVRCGRTAEFDDLPDAYLAFTRR